MIKPSAKHQHDQLVNTTLELETLPDFPETETMRVAWLSGNTLVSINEVTLRRAWLVLGWVTVCERVNHLGM